MCRRALVIAKDSRVRALLQMVLTKEGADVIVERNAKRGIELLDSEPFDVLFTELQSADCTELGVLREVHGILPTLPVVVISTCNSVESSVSAFRSGAVDYLAKPLRADQAVAALARAFGQTPKSEMPHWTVKPRRKAAVGLGPVTFVAASSAMKLLAEKCPPIAASTSPILIVGELGVGKQRIMQLIHSLSARRDEPWVTVNCDAMQKSRLVETFFGVECTHGSADETHHCGLIEQSAGGTLFLQNLTGIPRWMQKKLMQAAQTGVFFRQGGREPVAFRARIAASLRHNLANNENNGDLSDALCSYFGMTGLSVPPLRNRRKDILPLIDAIMCDATGSRQLRSRLYFTPEAKRVLEAYKWPGNIHELRNFIRRVSVFATSSVVSAATVHEWLEFVPAFWDRATETDRGLESRKPAAGSARNDSRITVVNPRVFMQCWGSRQCRNRSTLLSARESRVASLGTLWHPSHTCGARLSCRAVL
jgi:DNA-binding NtrC family response regulator